MPRGFISLCECLWQDWLAGRLETSPFIRQTFDLDAAPEPYIFFADGQKPLVLLTTNPGGTMPHQRRAFVQGGDGPLSPAILYAAAAKALGAFYEQQLVYCPAGRRIAAMHNLSASVGTDGFVQVEVCPFHSPSLPNKVGLLRELTAGGLLTRYIEEVREFLVAKPVVAISAASALVSMGAEMQLSPWVTRLTEVAGLDPKHADFVPLVRKEGKVTAMVLVSAHNGAPKALVLMMGGNYLPGEYGLRVLADSLARRVFHQ
jgi:hypothetical protein